MPLWRAWEWVIPAAIALLVLPWIGLVGAGSDQAVSAKQDREPGPLRISVNVDLVVLQATVTDRRGNLIHNLNEQDFEVYEDGVRQDIRLFKNEDIPVTAGLVVDHSSTMGPKLADVSAAARTFVRSSNAEDEMFVVNFNEKVSLGLPGTIRFSNTPGELEKAITRAPAGGETALYDAIARALVEVQAGTRDRRVLIVVSDGGDNASARSITQVMKLAGQSSAVIYTVGIFDEDDPDRNPRVLERLAQTTGGEAFFPKRLSDVVPICERIARDVRHQYTIGYSASNPASEGTHRAIRVVARAKGRPRLSVRTRTGYITGGAPGLDKKGAE